MAEATTGATGTFYYSVDGAEESDRLSVSLLPSLLSDKTITHTTLIFSEDYEPFSVKHDGWTTWVRQHSN